MRSLFVSVSLASITMAAGCGGGGSGGPPPEADDDFPLPLASGLAPTPPMGWNSWNKFMQNVSESLIKTVADSMAGNGMKDAGYRYVNIDDTWSDHARAADGSLQSDPSRFPGGIKALADYVHDPARGLKLGIYGDRGDETCGHYPGSQGHEAQDAQTFAGWGVDYLKYDNCSTTQNTDTPAMMQVNYTAMHDGLATAQQASGQPIVYAICAWGFYEWGVPLGQLWRTTGDIQDSWTSIYANLFATQPLAAYAGPNAWNDPDMLEVGVKYGAGGMTLDEYRSHFTMWAITASPLIAGNDVRDGHMPPEILEILTNKDVIALDQDHFALQAGLVRRDGEVSVWAKPLDGNGLRGVALLNGSDAAADITVSFQEIGLAGGSAKLRDLWAHADLGSFKDSYTASAVPSHGVVALQIAGNEPPRPVGTAFLSDLVPIYVTNGLGPIERDQSNGASDPGDGKTISLRQQTFTKGLGMAAPSMAIYRLGKKCTSFNATVGVDDAANGGGSVVFEVWADGDKVWNSDTLTGTSAAVPVSVDLTGRRRLRLRVTNAGDGTSLDRASWGDAKVDCAP
jgi:alpha-galactosidase